MNKKISNTNLNLILYSVSFSLMLMTLEMINLSMSGGWVEQGQKAYNSIEREEWVNSPCAMLVKICKLSGSYVWFRSNVTMTIYHSASWVGGQHMVTRWYTLQIGHFGLCFWCGCKCYFFQFMKVEFQPRGIKIYKIVSQDRISR